MKQGHATSDGTGSTKSAPTSQAVNPVAVSRLGATQIYGTPSPSLFSGSGLKAPMVSETVHKCGSQGKH